MYTTDSDSEDSWEEVGISKMEDGGQKDTSAATARQVSKEQMCGLLLVSVEMHRRNLSLLEGTNMIGFKDIVDEEIAYNSCHVLHCGFKIFDQIFTE